MPPLFSVIVTTRNRPELLVLALESIRAQTVSDFECIVVDDRGSVPLKMPSDERFRLLRSEAHVGLPAATNLGISRATGRYLAFLDDDDLWTRDRLELAGAGLRYAPVAVCWRADLATGKPGRNRLLFGNVHDVIFERSIPTKGQIAVHRDRVLPFDVRLTTSSDVEWWLRTSAVCTVHTVDRVGFLVRRHNGLRNSTRFAERVRCRRLIFDVHRDYFEDRPAIAATFLYRTARIARWAGKNREAIELLVHAATRLAQSLRPRHPSRGARTRDALRIDRSIGLEQGVD